MPKYHINAISDRTHDLVYDFLSRHHVSFERTHEPTREDPSTFSWQFEIECPESERQALNDLLDKGKHAAKLEVML